MAVISLLTDFGVQDEFVGVMHGVILGLCPRARIVNLCHAVPPGDCRRAAYLLHWAYRYFPRGTVHVVVVDPGVGTARRVLCARAAGHWFLAPDNGVLTRVLQDARRPVVRESAIRATGSRRFTRRSMAGISLRRWRRTWPAASSPRRLARAPRAGSGCPCRSSAAEAAGGPGSWWILTASAIS